MIQAQVFSALGGNIRPISFDVNREQGPRTPSVRKKLLASDFHVLYLFHPSLGARYQDQVEYLRQENTQLTVQNEKYRQENADLRSTGATAG